MKFIKKLYMCICLCESNINNINNIWDSEIKNNDGFLSDDLKSNLENCKNIVANLLLKLERYNINYTTSDAEKLVKEVYTFMFIENSKRKQDINTTIGYNFEWEKLQLPSRLLDATLSCSYTLNYMVNKLNICINKLNFDDEILILFNGIKDYVRFTEEELLLNKYNIR